MSRQRIFAAVVLGLFLGLLGLSSVQAQDLGSPALKGENPPPATDLSPESQPTPFTPKERVQIKINIPATRLDLYVEGKFKKSYKIAVGMPQYPTPITDLNISYIIWNPWWIPPDSEWAQDAEETPPGPGNPLGPVKMLLENGIRIHGTNAPGSIGRAASHACMRMYSKDAKELAWEIQQRYSEKNDAALLETYKKNSKTSYWVKLGEEVSVEIEYKLVEFKEDKILIHPDRYGRGGFQKALEAALVGQPEIVVDKELVKKLNGMRKKGSIEITLTQLKEIGQPALQEIPATKSSLPTSGLVLLPNSNQASSVHSESPGAL